MRHKTTLKGGRRYLSVKNRITRQKSGITMKGRGRGGPGGKGEGEDLNAKVKIDTITSPPPGGHSDGQKTM